MAAPENFNTNVFINCPFDDAYRPMFQAVVFTVLACGFTPLSALQESDAGTVRLDKIKRLIGESRLAIHDISRTASDAGTGLPRFNMPFELGLDLGAREYGRAHLKSKKYLILDREPHRFQQYLSDIAGQDISAHHDSVACVIEKIRDWLNDLQFQGSPPLDGPQKLTERYDHFCDELPAAAKARGLSVASLSFNDLSYFTGKWIEFNV